MGCTERHKSHCYRTVLTSSMRIFLQRISAERRMLKGAYTEYSRMRACLQACELAVP